MPALLLCALFALAGLGGCSSDPPDGDGDGDADVDSDIDADGDGDTCDPTAVECCEDLDCSDGIFCNGVEICDRGECQTDPDAVCGASGECRIVCDDGIECTDDSCDEATNRCVNMPVHERCDDDDICTGDERCVPADDDADARGCVRGTPLRCNDEDPCTDDYCEDGECRVRVRDSDGDGFGDMNCEVCPTDDPEDCERGTDCNDANPEVYPGAEEICDDGEDNDCNRARDYADDACTVPNDSCSDSTELIEGGVVHASTRGTAADIDTACGAGSDHDVAFHFTTMAVRDVTVRLIGRAGAMTASLTADCGAPEMEIRCLSGREFELRARSLPAGTYFVVVSSAMEVDFDIGLALAEPVPPIEGDLCTEAREIGAEGGSFSGDTTDMWADYDSNCGSPTDLDMAYTFTLAEPRSLDISVTPGHGPVAVAIQPDCGVPGSERSCFTVADEASGHRYYRSLDPGRYYLIFKTPEADTFSFEIEFGPPEPTVIEPWIDSSGHSPLTLAGGSDDGQYNLDIAPLTFPFNDETYGCLAVSTNGYIRFGPAGSCPSASGFSDSYTDVDQVFGAGTAQISWLGDDGYAGSSVTGHIDTRGNRVVITYLDHRDLGSSSGYNDVQIILYCDTGDIQISYGECTFDNSGYWSIGVSEPAHGGSFQGHDFPAHELGMVVSFGPGAVGQEPEHTGAEPYLPLLNRAIFFQRSGAGWEVIVDELPL